MQGMIMFEVNSAIHYQFTDTLRYVSLAFALVKHKTSSLSTIIPTYKCYSFDMMMMMMLFGQQQLNGILNNKHKCYYFIYLFTCYSC